MATAVRTQYLEMKSRHPDALLLFRMGDFYETFDEDAIVFARDTEIVLTQRDMGQGEIVPLAGIPYHTLDGYLARLIRKGHRVAICEQVSVPDGKRLVDRDVVRVVTPGTVIEPNLLEQTSNNYLVAVAIDGEQAGIAYVDVTTGEFGVTQMDTVGVEQELARLGPSEVIVPLSNTLSPLVSDGWGRSDSSVRHPERNGGEPKNRSAFSSLAYTVTTVPDAWFSSTGAHRRLCAHFEVTSLEAFGCERLPLAIAAAAATLDYLGDTYKNALPLLTGLRAYTTDAFMALDQQTRRNLELFEVGRRGSHENSLMSVLDKTSTPMGARLLRRWLGQPLLDITDLMQRQESVAWMYDSGVRRQQIRDTLRNVSDIERSVHRIGGGVAIPREVIALRRSLEQVPLIKSALDEDLDGTQVRWLNADLDPCADIAILIATAISDDPQGDVGGGKVVRDGFSRELDELKSASGDARAYIAGLEKRERDRTGIMNLKVGYNRVFGYYLEVTNSYQGKVPDDYVRRQTLVNAERFITPELKEYESLVLNASERLEELESALYRQVCRQISNTAARLTKTAAAIASTDVFAALAEAAAVNHYVRPTLDEGSIRAAAIPSVLVGADEPEPAKGSQSPSHPMGHLYIKNGRHPAVERVLPTGSFIANDTDMSTERDQLIMLTGPNMAGKSTYLRQVALIVLMAQIGSFVPADEVHVSLVDRIFTRIGLQDDLAAGQSTFMVEMVETAAILNQATKRSLVILDEIGRGTSTYDGLSIAQAVAEHIHNDPRLGCRTLFATHYHELTELADRLPGISNYSVAVAEEEGAVVFLHRIIPGGADRSYGVHVAQLAGLPRPVVTRAWELLMGHESGEHNSRTAKGYRLANGKHKTGQTLPGVRVEEQLDFFEVPTAGSPPVLEILRKLDLNGLTPIAALNKLYELQQEALD